MFSATLTAEPRHEISSRDRSSTSNTVTYVVSLTLLRGTLGVIVLVLVGVRARGEVVGVRRALDLLEDLARVVLRLLRDIGVAGNEWWSTLRKAWRKGVVLLDRGLVTTSDLVTATSVSLRVQDR